MSRFMSKYWSWEDYFIAGTSVLKNKLGITDNDVLKEVEEAHTARRIMELKRNPIQGNFDYDHMKAIHHYIFQDVYEWAGQERTAPNNFMSKDGHSYYPAGPQLSRDANVQYQKISEANYLRGMEREEFIKELGERWGELNVIHSFREGNTRSQFVFFSQLCEQAGYQLDMQAFGPEQELRQEFIQARFHGQDTGDNSKLCEVLGRGITGAYDEEVNLPACTQIESEMGNVMSDVSILDSLNPTGSVFVGYDPKSRATAPLAENMVSLSQTASLAANEVITIYRGVPKGVQGQIQPGDFVTTNLQLAKDYAGAGSVLEKQVEARDVLDDVNDPLGEEYIYRPRAINEQESKGKSLDTKLGKVSLPDCIQSSFPKSASEAVASKPKNLGKPRSYRQPGVGREGLSR